MHTGLVRISSERRIIIIRKIRSTTFAGWRRRAFRCDRREAGEQFEQSPLQESLK